MIGCIFEQNITIIGPHNKIDISNVWPFLGFISVQHPINTLINKNVTVLKWKI